MKIKFLCMALMLTLSSCYSVQVQSSYDDDVPVSLSKSYPQALSANKTRHFSHTFYQWYIVGLAPYDFWNSLSSESQGLQAQQYVDFVLKKEAVNAVAVKNVKVTVSRTPEAFLYGILVGLIPAVGSLINSNMSITVEGDVVEKLSP
jgi:hypothetical protein